MPDAQKRIQRRRTKGWRMPEGAVYVGRPSRWGNPFVVTTKPVPLACATTAEAARAFRATYRNSPSLIAEAQEQLRGKTLVCWCRESDACHADVLLEMANA